MRDETKKRHTEVIERYCPRRKENVILLRSYDGGFHTECVELKSCMLKKDKLCGRIKNET